MRHENALGVKFSASAARAQASCPACGTANGGEFVRAVKAPSIKGWRIAWTPDLRDLISVESEVATVAENAEGSHSAGRAGTRSRSSPSLRRDGGTESADRFVRQQPTRAALEVQRGKPHLRSS
jgi:hypothetical protein